MKVGEGRANRGEFELIPDMGNRALGDVQAKRGLSVFGRRGQKRTVGAADVENPSSGDGSENLAQELQALAAQSLDVGEIFQVGLAVLSLVILEEIGFGVSFCGKLMNDRYSMPHTPQRW